MIKDIYPFLIKSMCNLVNRFKFTAIKHTATTPNRIHEGRNVKRFREMLGIKQDALASDLGDDWNQQKVSLLEQKETIDPAILQQVSAVLKVPVAALQNFDEKQVVNIVTNTFTDLKIMPQLRPLL